MNKHARNPILTALIGALPLFCGEANAGWDCRADGGSWQCLPAASQGDRFPRAEAPSTPPQTASSHANWDWQPLEQIPAEQQTADDQRCCGRYQGPARDDDEAQLDPAQAPLRASAARSTGEGAVLQLEGEVRILKGQLALEADQARYDRNAQQLTLNGNVRVREPGGMFGGERAELDGNGQQGRIEQARFVLYQSGARGQADSIERRSDGTVVLQEGGYTQCTPDDDSWWLKAGRIELNPTEGFGTAEHARLEVAGVPVLYWPWLTFPIDDQRRSGWLYPSIGYGDRSGLDIALPYYINLAPHTDATLTPRYLSERGSMLEGEFRYRWDDTQWTVAAAALPGDRRYREDNPDARSDDRWALGIEQLQLSQGPLYAHIDATRVSDGDFFRDLDTASLDLRRASHLQQQVLAGWQNDQWQIELESLGYQTLDDQTQAPYEKLPELRIDFLQEWGNFRPAIGLDSSATQFFSDDRGALQGERYRAHPYLRLPMHTAALSLVPEIGLYYLDYQGLEQWGVEQEDQQVSVAQGSLDATLFFERQGERFLQTLEPRLRYQYTDYERQDQLPQFDTASRSQDYYSLWHPNHFTGGDRINDTNQATVGVTSRWIDQNSGRETLQLGIAQTFYFDDRRITPSGTLETAQRSPIGVLGQWQPNAAWRVRSELLWDADAGTMATASSGLHYHHDGLAANLSYRFDRFASDPVDQLQLSMIVPVSNSWRLFAGWHQDLDGNRPVEEFFGGEYSDCCWRLRAGYRRTLEDDGAYDKTLLLEWQLIGLGGLGESFDSWLKDSIEGYQP